MGALSRARALWAEALQELCPCIPAIFTRQGSCEFSSLHPLELRCLGDTDEGH